MGTGTNVAIVGGVTIAAAIGVYFLLQKTQAQGQGNFILQISATPGGTTNPAPSPSGVSYPSGKVVTITATPSSGNTIGDILVDGISIGALSTFQVTMNMSHTVNVIFYQGGVPPPSAPVAIVNLGNAQVWGYYGAKVFSLGAQQPSHVVRVNTTDQNWNYGATAFTQMKFKAIDSNGKGVPNINVQLWPSLFPDISKYQGYLILNYQMISQANPLTVKTDANGIATVNLSYYYGLNDNYLKICQDAELYLWYVALLLPVPLTVQDGAAIYGDVYSKGGYGETGKNAKMGNITTNTVIAQIPNTSIPQAQGLAYCGFKIKML